MYRGRFAPSPTGPLHFGSLVTAVASYLEARTQHGEWLLRMEDLDYSRTVAGASQDILNCLTAFGFEWDGSVIYQSQRSARYAQALARLDAQGLTYPCSCSRREIADSAAQGPEGAIYPGTCRHGLPPGKRSQAMRLLTNDTPYHCYDAIQGQVCQILARDIGDFILRRSDGLFAYQLAVVVDDAAQGITHIVRGADLLQSTPRQIYLQHLLHLPTPHYAHVPIVCNGGGKKLSKQTRARALDIDTAPQQLWQALDFLGQAPPAALQQANLNQLWQWALYHWSLLKIPRLHQHCYPPDQEH